MRSYDCGIDIGTVEELAIGLGEDPSYLWGEDLASTALEWGRTGVPVIPRENVKGASPGPRQ